MPKRAPVTRFVIGLFLLDGVLALLLAYRLLSASRAASTAELLFLAVLGLGGIAGVGLWRGQRWAVFLGLLAAGGAILLATRGVVSAAANAALLGVARYGLRLAVSAFVFRRLWLARSTSAEDWRDGTGQP